jgi:serine protease Do
MDRFVCIRVVQAWGLDLSLFQFDWRLTWAVFLMNGDKEIYGRYAPRHQEDLDGLKRTLEGALELHKNYPANKGDLAGKKGIAFPWKVPEEMPAIVEKGKFRPAEGKKGCIHCHNVQEGATKSFKAVGQPAPERFTAPWPTSQRAGFMLDFADPSRVVDVTSGSAADKAGLKVGDRMIKFGGQPVLSAADVQWVLWSGPDEGKVVAQVDRKGEKAELELALPAGWRTR